MSPASAALWGSVSSVCLSKADRSCSDVTSKVTWKVSPQLPLRTSSAPRPLTPPSLNLHQFTRSRTRRGETNAAFFFFFASDDVTQGAASASGATVSICSSGSPQ